MNHKSFLLQMNNCGHLNDRLESDNKLPHASCEVNKSINMSYIPEEIFLT